MMWRNRNRSRFSRRIVDVVKKRGPIWGIYISLQNELADRLNGKPRSSK
jgi:hypothetical protein